MSSAPSPRPVWPRNAATCGPSQVSGAMSPPSFHEAYQLARAAEAVRPSQSVPGYRVYWVCAGSFGSRDLRAGASDFAIAGRHTLCDVVLEGHPSVALRHLLLRTTCLDDGCPRLSVLDLQTHEGFELADGSRHRSLAGVGAIALRVGSHVLVALPSGEPAPADLPEPVQVHPYRQPARAFGQTMVSLLAPPVSIADREDSRAPGGPGTYAVTLQGERGHATTFVTGLDLARGVLFGRAPKCVGGGLREVLTMGISRVHLLVLPGREPFECIAYDLASTQGVYQHGQRARRFKLPAAGAQLRLGMSGFVDLFWRAL
ncbi:MAG TPA: hypothetical protein VLM85_22925 [Polyangiaceae bacterium]|nr:hypothetical protein [Polyangiaceae bacterium]